MPSLKPFLWLLKKEWRELLVSRAWWLMLFLIGPLTGLSFIGAVRSYADLSEGAGEILTPLIGIWAPTFSACELVAVFLLPFVVIHIVGRDAQSGALKLELQRRMPPLARIAAKSIIALAAWLIAMLPGFSAIALWSSYGGTIHTPELLILLTGHILNGALTISLGAAAVSLADHPSTAAILTLGVTVGGWVASFIAALQGGLWERIAAITPAAIVDNFQHGLLRLDTSLIAVTLIATGLVLAAIWQRIGVPARRRALESVATILVAALAILAISQTHSSWDLSENRANSFPIADEQALRAIEDPLRILVRLAPEDPRRVDLERNTFSKLRRVMPRLVIDYQSTTSTGIYEQANVGYGEIQYRMSGRQQSSRVSTPEGVLESIYSLAAIEPSKDSTGPAFRGHPMTTEPRGAALVFYGLCPALTGLCAFYFLRRR